MRLIDADALKTLKFQNIISGYGYNTAYRVGFNDAIGAVIKYAPTIDAVEVKHGVWEERFVEDDECIWTRRRFYCSACKGWTTYGKSKYCPECGAKMEKEGASDGR